MKTIIKNQVRGDERAYYGCDDTRFIDCSIAGEEAGESAFKECSNIELCGCQMFLRYPLWHVRGCIIDKCAFNETCRAPMWYCDEFVMSDTLINGVKAVRECSNFEMRNSRAVSAEFGWKTRGFTASSSYIESEYMFLDSKDISLSEVHIKGKYSFQYVKGGVIRNSVLDTKDAFWHSENVTVYDSVVKGEYLGWYSKGLRLVRCRISGTQPLCYASGLVLEDCTMTDCDLAFERSEVNASVCGHIDSVKNPEFGRITASSVGEIISERAEEERKTTLVLADGRELLI